MGILRAIRSGRTGKHFPTKWLLVVFLTFACFVLMAPSPIDAMEYAFHDGRIWGMLMGYGFQQRAWAEDAGGFVELTLFYPTAALLSYYWGPVQVALDLQALLGVRTSMQEGFLAGGGPVVRASYNTSFKLSPYIHLGLGVLYTDMDLERMGTRENFFQELGAGIQFKIIDRLSACGEYRRMHVSNAGLSEENIGFDTNMVLMGLWYSF